MWSADEWARGHTLCGAARCNGRRALWCLVSLKSVGFLQANGGGEFRFFLLKIPKCQLETPCLLGHPCRSCRNSLRWRRAAQFRYQMTTAVRAACSGPSSWWPPSWRQSERRQPPSAVSVSTVAHRTLQHVRRTRPRDLATTAASHFASGCSARRSSWRLRSATGGVSVHTGRCGGACNWLDEIVQS